MSGDFSYFNWFSETITQLELTGNSPEALIQAQRYVHCFPGYRHSESLLSILRMSAGTPQLALRRAATMATVDYHSPVLRTAEIAVLLALGNTRDATVKWQRALKEIVDLEALLLSMIQGLVTLKDFSFAPYVFETIEVKHEVARHLKSCLRALVAALTGETQRAQEELDQVSQETMNPPLLYFLARAQLFFVKGCLPDGYFYVRSVLDKLPVRDQPTTLLAASLLQTLVENNGNVIEAGGNTRVTSLVSWSYADQLSMALPHLSILNLHSEVQFQSDRLRISTKEYRGQGAIEARAALELNNPQLALVRLDEIPLTERGSLEETWLRARTMIALGQFQEFQIFLTSPASATLKASRKVFSLFEDLFACKQHALALQALEYVPSGNRDPFTFASIAIRALSAVGQIGAIQKSFETNGGGAQTNPHLLLLRAEIEKTESARARAREYVVNLASQTPDDANVWLSGANCLNAFGDSDLGLRLLGVASAPLELDEITSYLRRTPRSALNPKNKIVVFMSSNYVRTRHLKMARSLRKIGWTTILVTRDLNSVIPENCFDAVHRVDDEGKVLALVASYRPQICHVSTWLGDGMALRVIKEKIAKSVLDPTDYGSGLITNPGCSLDELYQNECLKLADGFCARDTRPQTMKRDLAIPHPPRTIFFPDYCWNEEQYSVSSQERLDGIHVVSVGGAVARDKEDNLDYGINAIAKKFAENGIHFHVYPAFTQVGFDSQYLENEFGPLIEFGKKTGFAHVHKAIKSEDVPQAISKYHFGLAFHLPTLLNRPLVGFTYRSMHNCGSARTTDYLDAGLFVCLNSSLHFGMSLLKSAQISVPIDLAFVDNPLPPLKQKLDTTPFERIAEFRKSFSTDAHIRRLEAFYNSL